MISTSAPLRKLFLTLFALVFVTALILAPVLFSANAGNTSQPASEQTRSQDPEYPKYDSRTDKKAFEKIARIRSRAGRGAPEVADIRGRSVSAEARLRSHVPSLKVEYNNDLRIPEVIGTDVKRGKAFLSAPSSAKRSDILKGFLRENLDLTGLSDQQVSDLKVASDYKNPEDDLSFVQLEQDIDGIPGFRGGVKAGFGKNRELVRVINNLAPGLDHANVSKDFGDPSAAVAAATEHVGDQAKGRESLNPAESTDEKLV